MVGYCTLRGEMKRKKDLVFLTGFVLEQFNTLFYHEQS